MSTRLRTKLDRLLAVYAMFADETRGIADPEVLELHRMAAGVPQFLENARLRVPKPTNSQITSGLEEALRELTNLGGLKPHSRAPVRRAIHLALSTQYPEFLSLDESRLSKVIERGRIRTEAEFYLVRHRIDVIEGEPKHEGELDQLYALVGDYEARL
jgi:hypothetical protein